MRDEQPDFGLSETLRNPQSTSRNSGEGVMTDERAPLISCRKCRQQGQPFRYLDVIDRIRLADDPADLNCGHFYLETVHVMQCPACGHAQEHLQVRTPYASLREAQSQLDAHLLGKG